jgi:hypothetical protein
VRLVVKDQTGSIRPIIDSPLSRLIKREIDQKEFVRQMNEKRERHGLPPMKPQSASSAE